MENIFIIKGLYARLARGKTFSASLPFFSPAFRVSCHRGYGRQLRSILLGSIMLFVRKSFQLELNFRFGRLECPHPSTGGPPIWSTTSTKRSEVHRGVGFHDA